MQNKELEKKFDILKLCAVFESESRAVNIFFGPPFDKKDDQRAMSKFFSQKGVHIICGGTTAEIASAYLKKPVFCSLDYNGAEFLPVGCIDGKALVTEGVLTVSKAAEYAKEHIKEAKDFKDDAAGILCKILFGKAKEINLFLGTAKNPAHQSETALCFDTKSAAAKKLCDMLKQTKKQVNIIYF